MSAPKPIGMFLISLAFVSPAWSALVWQSTFDTTADGVVNIKDRDSTKVMIGPASAGRLQITTKDLASPGGFNNNDRAGRPLGSTLSGNDSFSGLVKFRWSALSQSTSAIWEGFGFSGSDGCPTNCLCTPNICNTTSQVCGGLLQHRRDATGENFVRLGVQFSAATSAGNPGVPFNAQGTEVDIGQDAAATSNDFYLALGYDSSSHVLSIAMFDANGAFLGSASADLDAAPPAGITPQGTNTVQTVLNALQVTHLGWNDYVAGGLNLTNVWQVDSLAYYNNARGAFDAVPNQTTVACCLPTGTCDDGNTSQGCLARGGTVGNATCGATTCPPPLGACCHPDGSCSQETQTACTGISGTWQGANTACSLSSCPQPPTGACCSGVDGTCTDGKTQFNCTGNFTFQGAGTLCANITCPPPPPGACCLPNGACVQLGAVPCGVQCGTFNGVGTSCATANCTQPALGACCLPNGTCSMTHEYDCAGAFHGPGSDCTSANCQPMPSLVWWSNFATSNDGVVDVQNNNPNKDLIGPQCNGQLPIHTRAFPNSFEANDRGGRPVGGTLTGNNSFSGLYRFKWNDLPEDTNIMAEFPAFIGNKANATEQILGTLLSHNKVGTDYFVRMCSAGGENTNYFLFQCGATFNLGPDAETRSFQLVISYDGTSHLLTHSILDDQGNLLGTAPTQSFQTWDLDTVCPSTTFCPNSTIDGVGCQNYFDCTVPCPTCTKQTKYNSLALTHLGWSDYTSLSGGTLDTFWQVDSLAYFNTAGGAYDAVFGAVPRGACCQANGSCVDNETELACLASAGAWNGASSTCATTTCAGACCLPIGDCLDNQTVPSCNAAGGTFKGLNTSCAQTTCPLPPCHNPFADADGDGDVDMDDFGIFQRCYSGAGVPFTSPGLCHCFDRPQPDTPDGDIDGDDFVKFLQCAGSAGSSGANVPVDTTCDGAP